MRHPGSLSVLLEFSDRFFVPQIYTGPKMLATEASYPLITTRKALDHVHKFVL